MLLLRPAQVKFSFCFFSKKALEYYFYLFCILFYSCIQNLLFTICNRKGKEIEMSFNVSKFAKG